jgi:hypothetical protein
MLRAAAAGAAALRRWPCRRRRVVAVAAAAAGGRRDPPGWARRHYVPLPLVEALEAHKEHFGHVRVPSRFVVPNDDPAWPREAHGMTLGSRVSKLRVKMKQGRVPPEDAAQLDQLGFVWDMHEFAWQRTLEALQMYKTLHGDLEVMRKFVVPSAAPWPEKTWGVRLGISVNTIRMSMDSKPERVEALNQLGFFWDDYERLWQRTLAALRVYNELHGDLEVPRLFTVPSTAPWPEDLWGLQLGQSASSIRGRGHHVKDRPDRVELLDQLGFRFVAREWAPDGSSPQ